MKYRINKQYIIEMKTAEMSNWTTLTDYYDNDVVFTNHSKAKDWLTLMSNNTKKLIKAYLQSSYSKRDK